MVVANLRYQSSQAGNSAGKVRDLARYFQYRQDRDQHRPQTHVLERWVDHGLGGNFRQIAERCEAYKSPHVQAFFLVINPHPELMALVDKADQEAFVKTLTERSLDAFFTGRGLAVPEYSYAYHLRATLDAARRDNPHTHVILPGTYDSWADGGRLPLYMNRGGRDNHIELLHRVVEQQAEQLLERYVGPDWEQHFDARHPPASPVPLFNPLEGSADHPDEPPHARFTDSQGQVWQTWVATRTDLFEDDTQQVGFLVTGSQPDAEPRFVPQVSQLAPAEADALAGYMRRLLLLEGAEVTGVFHFAAQLAAMRPDERAALFRDAAIHPPPEMGQSLER